MPWRPLLVALLALSSCKRGEEPAPRSWDLDQAYCGAVDTHAVEERIDGLLDQLTLEEKTRMMRGDGLAAEDGIWRASGIEEHGIPGILSIDGPRGVSQGAGHATAFPVASMRGATWDPELEREVGRAIGAEVRAVGANTLLAPTINIGMHPRWGRAQEAYGEDPLHVGDFGVAFIEGAQEHVLATAKHFAANNIEDTRFDVDAIVDERTLREIYLPQFERAATEAQVASVMSAYNQVNGDYASQNPHLLDEILRQEWGWSGFVMSDWIFGTHETVPAIEAGLDLDMPTEKIYGAPLAQAVTDGLVDEALVDRSVRRLLRAQFCHELDVDPPVVDPSILESQAHLDLARRVAERGMVLLKNPTDLLPIDRDAAPEIVVIGRLAEEDNIGDRGSSSVDPSDVVSAWEGLSAAAAPAPITRIAGDLTDPQDRTAVTQADVVIAVVGLSASDEGEGMIGAGDRTSLEIPAADQTLLVEAGALTDSLVVVLEGSSAMTMPWLDQADALLMAFYPGSRGGDAIANTLFGEVNPSGRLPMVFPVAEADLPPFDNTSLSVEYSDAHGYRHLEREGIEPLFPMGFGLAYTTFTLANAAAVSSSVDRGDVVRITVDATNTGDRTGRVTVQVYAAAPDSPERRYLSELRAYTQVELDAAQTTAITLEIPVSDLARYDVTEQGWRVESGTHSFFVGQHHGDPAARRVDVEVRGD